METNTILKRASEKSGLTRVRYKENRIPTSPENVTVFPFFGDRRSLFIFSSILLKRIREEMKSSKYFVVASWPGYEGMFDSADEYWQVEDSSMLGSLIDGVQSFGNHSTSLSAIVRSLNQYLYDIMSSSDIVEFYELGLKSDFFERFRHVKVSLPSVPSFSSLGVDASRTLSRMKSKVFFRPFRYLQSWKNGKVDYLKVSKDFWIELSEFLTVEGFGPVILCDYNCYDISSEINNSCYFSRESDALKSLSLMRNCGCVLDLFTGDSRFALAARCPFLCFDERQRFSSFKEYEIDDLCGFGLKREYIFSFTSLVSRGDSSVWKSNIFEQMAIRLNSMNLDADRDSWPSPIEVNDIVPYDSVRKRKAKKFGTRFIKVADD